MPAPVNPHMGNLDQQQILQRAFDESTDKLRVDASVSVTTIQGDVQCEIDAADGDNIAISDGTLTAGVTESNGNNGLNVYLTNPEDIITPTFPVTNTYNEITSLASSNLTTILSTTALTPSRLILSEVSGSNIAEYTVEINSIVIAKARTYFGSSLNHNFDFKDGINLLTNDIVRVRVIHYRPELGDFNARIEIKG